MTNPVKATLKGMFGWLATARQDQHELQRRLTEADARNAQLLLQNQRLSEENQRLWQENRNLRANIPGV